MASNSWRIGGPFPSGDYVLVLMHEHCRFPEVEIIRSTFTPVTIERLEKIFSVHGFSVEFVSNNGHLLTAGHGFHYFNYLEQNGIKHRKITPHWPQGRNAAITEAKEGNQARMIDNSQPNETCQPQVARQ